MTAMGKYKKLKARVQRLAARLEWLSARTHAVFLYHHLGDPKDMIVTAIPVPSNVAPKDKRNG